MSPHRGLCHHTSPALRGGDLPATPGPIAEATEAHDGGCPEEVLYRLSDNGAGTAGQTQLDLLLDGATLYPSTAPDDHRPAWPFDAGDLVQQTHIHELTDLHPGQLLQLITTEHPTDGTHPGGGLSPLPEALMSHPAPLNVETAAQFSVGATLVVALTPGYRLKITRPSRMSDLADRILTAVTAVGGSAAFLEILRRWLQRRQDKRKEQLQLDVRVFDEGHALRQEAYQREREALQALAEERERRHQAELQALEAQLQGKIEALTCINQDLTDRLNALKP